MKKRILGFFPHITLILALFMGTLWVLDQLNPLMNFLDNGFVSAVQMLFCISVVIASVSGIWYGNAGGES